LALRRREREPSTPSGFCAAVGLAADIIELRATLLPVLQLASCVPRGTSVWHDPLPRRVALDGRELCSPIPAGSFRCSRITRKLPLNPAPGGPSEERCPQSQTREPAPLRYSPTDSSSRSPATPTRRAGSRVRRPTPAAPSDVFAKSLCARLRVRVCCLIRPLATLQERRRWSLPQRPERHSSPCQP
jgi:hypothetical protein